MPKVFLSHSKPDQWFIDDVLIPELHRHSIETWYSKENIRTSEEWERMIEKGLNECDWFLVILSENAIYSKWLKVELLWAFDNREGKVIPLLLSECNTDKINLRLRTLQYLDFRNNPKKAMETLISIWGEEYLPSAPIKKHISNKKSNTSESTQLNYEPVLTKDSIGLGDLTLTEQLYILYCRDNVTLSDQGYLCVFAVQAMAIAELVMAKKVTIRPFNNDQILIEVIDRTPFKNPILDNALNKITNLSKKNPANLAGRQLSWLFDSSDPIIVIQQLIVKGILEEKIERTFFGLFTTKKYSLTSINKQKKAKQKFSRNIVSGSSLSMDLELLIVIAKACNLNSFSFPEITAFQIESVIKRKNNTNLLYLIDRMITMAIADCSDDDNNSYQIACS